MFHISFSPMRRDDRLSLAVAGESLILNGARLDLSAIPEGATLPRAAVACDWLAGDIQRHDGVLHLALILPHGPIPWPAPPQSLALVHPEPVIVGTDGPVALPAWMPEETAE